MFRRRKKEAETLFDKRKALINNTVLTFAVVVILGYQFIQAIREPDPTPLWFIAAMTALCAGCTAILIRNGILIKKINERVKEEPEQVLEESEQPEGALTEERAEEEPSKQPEEIPEAQTEASVTEDADTN